MAFSKLYDSPAAAVADVSDGCTVLIGGTTQASEPTGLLAALASGGRAQPHLRVRFHRLGRRKRPTPPGSLRARFPDHLAVSVPGERG